MPDHVHLILGPADEDGLRGAPDWRGLLKGGLDEPALDEIRRHVRSGHPLGKDGYYKTLQKLLGRDVKPRPRDRPKAAAE